MTIDEIVSKYPKLNFLKSPAFQTLTAEKQRFLLGCVEDALFWVELEKRPHVTDGFKFLTAAYGLMQAKARAEADKLSGKEKEKFLKPHEDLYTQYCPHFGTDSIINE